MCKRKQCKTANFPGKATSVDKDTSTQEARKPYETCVICGKATGVQKDTPIQKREGYIVGGGQLCWECYYDLYLKSKSERK